MSIVEIKMAIDRFFDFNYILAGIIMILLILASSVYISRRNKVDNRCLTWGELVSIIMWAGYISLLLGGTLLGRSLGEEGDVKWVLFWSYRQFSSERNYNLLIQMIFNVLIFIPWPILFSTVFPKMRKAIWCIGSAFLFSVFIEVTQLVFKLGLFEFDDMFHNVLGAIIGYYIWVLYRKLKKKGAEE